MCTEVTVNSNSLWEEGVGAWKGGVKEPLFFI